MVEDKDEIMANDCSDSGDSDSSFEEVVASEEEMQLITQLEDDLQSNLNQYDKHIQVHSLSNLH